MCIKKEYKCYKGKENEECCNERVREALRNRTYAFVLVLGIALMIISLVIKTSNDQVFVNQVSFASTITSIILSVIAIWLSISGERNTNEIKEKVSESVYRLIKTTDKSDKLAVDLGNMLSKQNETYNNIKSQMESVLSEVQGVKTTIISMNDSFMGTKENEIETFPIDNFLFCKNIMDGIPDENIKKVLCETLIKIFEVKKNNKTVENQEIYDMIDNTTTSNKLAIFGMIAAFVHNGFFKDINNYEKLIKLAEKLKIEEKNED